MPLLDPAFLLRALLVFVRIGGVMVAAPVFGQQSVPVRVRVLLSVLLAYALAGVVESPLPPHVAHTLGFTLAVGLEALTGLALGFAARFVFLTVEFAGEVIGYQMGLTLAQVYDPVSGHAANPVARLINMMLLTVFILIGGHHQVLYVLHTSFEVVPLAGARISEAGPLLLEWMSAFFEMALRLAAPFMITQLMIDLTLGVFARVVPQANLFILSFAIKILVGLTLSVFFLQHFLPLIPDLVRRMTEDLLHLLEALSPIV